MARKEKIIRIEDENSRDFGRYYRIKEMPAYKAEKWLGRLLLILASKPSSLIGLSEGVSVSSLVEGVKWETIEPLLEEMMNCVEISSILKPEKTPTSFRALKLEEDDIEDVQTLIMLRKETIELHLGFTLAEKLSI